MGKIDRETGSDIFKMAAPVAFNQNIVRVAILCCKSQCSHCNLSLYALNHYKIDH